MARKPTSCVIGAGISGLTAGKALSDWGLPHTCYPDFPGGFDGEEIHSHHYLDPTTPLDLIGKRVLVVGIGNSAVDITSELSRKGVAEKMFISTRSGAWVVPKYMFGRPTDKVVKTDPRLPLKLQRWLADQLHFLRRHLSPTPATEKEPDAADR